jgi:hypothetical protein
VPAKSKGRCNIQKGKTNLENVSSSVIEPDAVSQTAKTGGPGSSDLKAPTTTDADYKYFVKDLKWIGVVTGIIVIFLVVAYLLIR